MNKFFSYSVLQHHYSSFVDEVVNIGVLFFFSDERLIKFQSGNISRLTYLYSNIDTTTISRIIKSIEKDIISYDFQNSLFTAILNEDELHNTFLKADDSSLQFTKPKKSIYPFPDVYRIIEQYSALLLPDIQTKPTTDEIRETRFNELQIIRRYTNYIHQKNSRLDKLLRRQHVIQDNEVKLTFDVGWKNGHLNWVKAVSFDLKEEENIQDKAVRYFGYLTKLTNYAVRNDIRYDLIVWKPQDKKLESEYLHAVNILESADAPKKIVTEENLEEYSEDTLKGLSKELEESLDEKTDEFPY